MLDSIVALFKASLKDPHVGPSRRRSSVRPMNVKNHHRCNDCQMIQMENQKLRSKVAQLEVQIAEMKSQIKNGPYSGKCTYELGFSNGVQNGGQIGHSRQSSMRMSSTSIRSKPKLTKVESSPLPGTRPRTISNRSDQDSEPQQEIAANRKAPAVTRHEPLRQSFRKSQNGFSRDPNPNGILEFNYDAPRESVRVKNTPRVTIPGQKQPVTKPNSQSEPYKTNEESSASSSPVETIRCSHLSRRRSSSVDDIPILSKKTPFSRGSTITRTVISKNGEERRQAFRSAASNNNQRKSSIEKLEDIRVSRSSKGPSQARLAMRRTSSVSNINNTSLSLIQFKQNSVTAGPFQLLK